MFKRPDCCVYLPVAPFRFKMVKMLNSIKLNNIVFKLYTGPIVLKIDIFLVFNMMPSLNKK